MSSSLREIYWVLILLSLLSSILYIATKSVVKADVLIEVHTADTNNSKENVSIIAEDLENVIDSGQNLNQKSEDKEDTKKHEVAEIVSSFGDASQASKTDFKTTVSDKAFSDVPSVTQADTTNKLSETSQAVVFTLVDSASVEIQQQFVSASQQADNVTVKNASLHASQPTNVPIPTSGEDAESIKEHEQPDGLSPETENKTQAEPDEQYVVRAERKIIVKEDLSDKKSQVFEPVTDAPKTEVVNDELLPVTNDTNGESVEDGVDSTDHSTPPEDIPSFSEWAQKQLAEAEEKQKVAVNINASASPTASASRTGGALKLRSKNYASPDCGAKIVATNPEAASASSVLSPSRDEYLLNTCTSRIWFVIELCEAIQAKKIELANFELFSSSPREFSVYISDRVQTRDWRSVGYFTAEDERTIQNFTLSPQLFGKYIKVEFHSHYGSEHFCPVSLFRVYGTSEFEVLERVDEVHENSLDIGEDDDDDEDGALDVDTGDPPKNLFNSAKDAVMSIVKKAAEALGKGSDIQNETIMLNTTVEETALEVSHLKFCKSPRHIVVCDNCSDALFSDVYQLISCEEASLKILMSSPFVYDVIRDGQLCSKYGLFFSNRRLGAPYPLKQTDLLIPTRTDSSDYISAFFPPQYIAALCNMLAIFEKRVALNISEEPNTTSTITFDLEDKKRLKFPEHGFEDVVLPPASTCSVDNSAASQPCSSPGVSNIELATSVPITEPYKSESEMSLPIKPTKTLSIVEEIKDSPSLPTESSTSSVITGVDSVYDSVTEETIPSVVTATDMPGDQNKTQGNVPDLFPESTPSVVIVEPKEDLDGNDSNIDASAEEQNSDTLDTLLKDLKDLDQAAGSSSSSSNVPAATSSTSSSTSLPPSNVPPAQQVQKESVFLRLANRIKALERNMSLSGQYLEELSRRYKKQMEEMQRAFNRTLAALGEESRKGQDREEKRMEEMLALQQQLTTLSAAVEVLLAEREGWPYKANVIVHHVILITVEVLIFILVLYLCRRMPVAEDSFNDQRKMSIGWRSKKNSKTGGLKRRKSIDVISTRECPKLLRRRPSEEALNIAGTYRDLLITETGFAEMDGGTMTVPKGESKRRRRKKKELLMKSSSANMIPQSAPLAITNGGEQYPEVGAWWSVSNGVTLEEEEHHQMTAPDLCIQGDRAYVEQITSNIYKRHSSPVEKKPSLELETSRKLSDSNLKSENQDLELRTKKISSESTPAIVQNNGLVRSVSLASPPTLRHVSSPTFMRTAISSRSGRHNSGSVEPSPQAKLKSDNWEWYSSHHNVSSQGVQLPCTSNRNGQAELENTRRTSNVSSTSDVSRKENGKRGSAGGLKKMVSLRDE